VLPTEKPCSCSAIFHERLTSFLAGCTLEELLQEFCQLKQDLGGARAAPHQEQAGGKDYLLQRNMKSSEISGVRFILARS